MKKIYLLLFALFALQPIFGQSNPEFWFGLDGGYTQNSIKATGFVSPENERFGSVRPMIGLSINSKWDIGIMMSVNSYIEEISPLFYSTEFANFDGEGSIISYSTRTNIYQTTMDNQLFGVGIFARRNFQFNEKFSFNLNTYALRETGDDGVMNLYYSSSLFVPCTNCLSFIPGPIKVPLIEENWRAGIDAAFAYQATDWMKLEIRANLFEFRRQKLTDDRNLVANGSLIFDPFLAATQGYFGSYSDFGSAVTREGIRFGVVISPF